MKNYEVCLEALVALADAIEAKVSYAKSHSKRVTEGAVAIARKMGLPPERLEELQVAGVLHDIGKIGVLESVLEKPGELTYEEYVLVKRHPLIAEEILKGIKKWAHIVEVIRHHHEWYDGMGYPDGLREEKIPLESRILAVADSVEAMGSERPYRAAMTKEEMEAILKEGAGSQWDPEVIGVALELLRSGGLGS